MPNTLPELTAEHVKLIGDLLVPRMVQELRGEFQRLRGDFAGALARDQGQTREHFGAVEARVAALESPGNKRLADIEGRLVAIERLTRRAMLGYGFLVALATWAYHLGRDAVGHFLSRR